MGNPIGALNRNASTPDALNNRNFKQNVDDRQFNDFLPKLRLNNGNQLNPEQFNLFSLINLSNIINPDNRNNRAGSNKPATPGGAAIDLEINNTPAKPPIKQEAAKPVDKTPEAKPPDRKEEKQTTEAKADLKIDIKDQNKKPTQSPGEGKQWVWAKNHKQWEAKDASMSTQQKKDIETGKIDPLGFDLNKNGKLDFVKGKDGKNQVTNQYDWDGNGSKDTVNKTKDGVMFLDKPQGKQGNNNKMDAKESIPTVKKAEQLDANKDKRLTGKELDNMKLMRFDDHGKEKVQSLKNLGIKSLDLDSFKKATQKHSDPRSAQVKSVGSAQGQNGPMNVFNFDFLSKR